MKTIITIALLTAVAICNTFAQNDDFEMEENTNNIFSLLPNYKPLVTLTDTLENGAIYIITMDRYQDFDINRLEIITEKVGQAIGNFRDSFQSDYSQKTLEIATVRDNNFDIVRKREVLDESNVYTYINGEATQIKNTFDTIRVIDNDFIINKKGDVTTNKKIVYEFIFKDITTINREEILKNHTENKAFIASKTSQLKLKTKASKFILNAAFGIASNVLIPIAPSMDLTVGYRTGRGSTFVGLNAGSTFSYDGSRMIGLQHFGIELGGMKTSANSFGLHNKASLVYGAQFFGESLGKFGNWDYSQAKWGYYMGLNYPIYKSISMKVSFAGQFKKNPDFVNIGVGFYYNFL